MTLSNWAASLKVFAETYGEYARVDLGCHDITVTPVRGKLPTGESLPLQDVPPLLQKALEAVGWYYHDEEVEWFYEER